MAVDFGLGLVLFGPPSFLCAEVFAVKTIACVLHGLVNGSMSHFFGVGHFWDTRLRVGARCEAGLKVSRVGMKFGSLLDSPSRGPQHHDGLANADDGQAHDG